MAEIDKYAIYLRKSRADVEAEKLGEGETLARHKKILTELAARNGYYIEKIYHEIVSGETIQARPQMQELIQDCYAGKYKGVLVIEVTRLSRGNQGDAQTILDCLKYANNNRGVQIITPTKVYDVAHSPDDEEYMEFELFMSRREYKMIQKRMERGRIQAVVEGNYMGSYRPYGYDILKTKTGRTLVANAEEAPVVKNIFEWTVKENMTPGKIAKRLNALNIPTYSGDMEWSISTIKTILTNPVYIGKVRWNDRMKVKTMVNGELITSRPRSNHTQQYMLYDGKHKAIIDDITFHKAEKRFHSDKTKGNLKLQNPFAGLLYCQKCGKTMAYRSYKNKENTEPRLIHPPSDLCKVKSAMEKDVTNAVVHSLGLYIEEFKIKVDNLPQTDENTILGQIEGIEKEIRKTEKKLSKLFDAWESETITDNEFVKRKAVNTEKIETLKREIKNLENSIPEKEDYEEKIMAFSDALEALKDKTLEADIKNEYLKRIIEKIDFSRENNNEFILDIYIK